MIQSHALYVITSFVFFIIFGRSWKQRVVDWHDGVERGKWVKHVERNKKTVIKPRIDCVWLPLLMYGLWYILWLLYTTNAFVLVIDKSTHSTRLRDDNENNCIYQKYMDGNSMTGYYTANQISDHPRKSVTKLSRRADRITSHLFFFIYFFLFLFLPHQTQSHVVWRKWLTCDLWVMEWKKEKEKTPSSSEKNAYLSVRILYKLYYVYLNVCFPVQYFTVYQPIYLHRQTQRERKKQLENGLVIFIVKGLLKIKKIYWALLFGMTWLLLHEHNVCYLFRYKAYINT